MEPGLDYLRQLAPWTGKGEFSREGIRKVLNILGEPQDKVPAIHVAGTNGKGSVSIMVASCLAACGHRVGVTVSPHLSRMNERIVVDGLSISDRALNAVACDVEAAARDAGVELSFFEAITACAFLHFSRVGLDFMVVEVGLGGRLDATNVITRPVATTIVSIDSDHEEILGPSLTAIAREKSGILKNNVAAIVGEIKSEPLAEIVKCASAISAHIRVLGKDFSVRAINPLTCEGGQDIEFVSSRGEQIEIKIPLLGLHQIANAAVALEISTSLGVSRADCQSGMRNAFWPGRLEWARFKQNDVLFDAAHNVAGVQSVVNFILANKIERLNVAFGAIATKRWQEMIALLSPIASSWTILEPDFPKRVSCNEISDFLKGRGVASESFGSNYRQFVDIRLAEGRGERWLVLGSIYLLGAIRECMQIPERPLWVRIQK